MEYELELERVCEEIKKAKAKRVCVQLPDGLKPEAEKIAKELKEKTNAEIIIWLGSCFGACDIPKQVEEIGIDFLIQWGHSEWKS